MIAHVTAIMAILSGEIERNQPDPGRAEPSRQPTVVIIDREALYRWFVTESLDPVGIRVMPYRTIADAARYVEERPGRTLVLIDAQTLADEGQGGFAQLHARFPSLPCVVLEPESPSASLLHEPTAPAPTAEKPVDSGALVALVDAHFHHPAPPG